MIASHNWIKYAINGEQFVETFPVDASCDCIFCEAARMICFSDCTDIEVIDIVVRGEHYEYAGWRPNMEYAFIDPASGEEVWHCFFPEWDH